MMWEQLQEAKTEAEVDAILAKWIGKADRAAEKKKRAWIKKAVARKAQILNRGVLVQG